MQDATKKLLASEARPTRLAVTDTGSMDAESSNNRY